MKGKVRVIAACLLTLCLLTGCGASGKSGTSASTSGGAAVSAADGTESDSGSETGGGAISVESSGESASENADTPGASTNQGTVSGKMESLQKTLADMTDDGNTWAVYVKDLTTGETVGINSRKQVLSASIIKIFIAGAYYQAQNEGKYADDYQQQLSDMIIYSDNTATNTLIDLIGMDYINQFIQDQGFSEQTQLNRKMLEDGTENYVTAKDCGDVLERIYNRTYVSPEASEQIWNYLKQQDSRNKIPAGITDEAAVIGNKTGEIGGNAQNSFVIGDVALIYGSHADMIICLIENGSYSEDIKSRISQMAGKIYETCNGDSSAGNGETGTPSPQQPSADEEDIDHK